MKRGNEREFLSAVLTATILIAVGSLTAYASDDGAGSAASADDETPVALDANGTATAEASAATPVAATPSDVFRDMNEPWASTERRIRLDREDMNVIRRGPGERYAVLRVVEKGDSFPVLAKRDEWYNVQLSETQTGWVHESLCEEYDDFSDLEFRPNPRLFSRVGSFTFTAYAGGYTFDRKSNSFTTGGRLGYYLFDFFEVEGGVSWTHVTRPAEIVESLFDLSLEAEDFHMLFYEMNGNLKVLPGRQLVPYLTAGIGSSILRGKTESSFNYGGGIQFYVKRRAALRWEFRTYRFDSGPEQSRRTNNNYTFTLGTTFLL